MPPAHIWKKGVILFYEKDVVCLQSYGRERTD